MIQIITAFYIEKRVGIEGVTNIQQTMMAALVCMAIAAIAMQAFVIQMFKITTRTMCRIGLPVLALVWSCCTSAAMSSCFVSHSAFMGASLAMANAGITGGASLSVAPHEQGALGGFLSAAPILGMVVGPLAGTTLFEMFSPTFPVVASFGVLVVLSLYALTVKVPDK